MTTWNRSREVRQYRHSTPPSLTVRRNRQSTGQHVEDKSKRKATEAMQRNGALVRHPWSSQTARRVCQRRKISSAVRIGIVMGIDGTIPQLTYRRAPQKGQHSHPGSAALLVARDVYLGGTICSRMCNLPTEQNMHHQEENTLLSHSRRPLHVPIQHCSLRPHHTAAQSKWIQCYPHHHGPRMFQSHYLPPLSHDDHWRGSSPVIPQAPVPMVRSSFKGNL